MANSVNKNPHTISRGTTTNSNKKASSIERSSKHIKKNDKNKNQNTSNIKKNVNRRNPETSGRTTAIAATTQTTKIEQLKQNQQQHQQQQQQQRDEKQTTYVKVTIIPTLKKKYSKIIAAKPCEDVESNNAKYMHEFRDKTVVNFIFNFFF